ncbi:G2/mitotic-specific cyclin cdc13, putative [Rhizoctonia solani AG-3 Rhs1AP]|uniref:G2/mitotic-specific cyclin cdc13, putative n=2 Tax=Rhizoctonia solani AG-3 TaxID=1086053 RepID=X8IZ73_9AGAM|nr:G2/mitotic-specific cyclin cdc13, putative [Rhizoctonia solani AG-3 Rhs1AP]KEP46263.1 putative G2/mitotic-specific cyclin cdc13 [Rhizoctonia solani 123E]
MKLEDPKPYYHRAIPVLSFLRVKSLGETFEYSYVFFSHFAIAGDSKMLSSRCLLTALVRGIALQVKNRQEPVDLVIPVHMESRTKPFTEETTSAIYLQFKKREGTLDCPVNRLTSTASDMKLPVISIAFQFGVRGKKSNTVEIPVRTPRQEDRSHLDDRHYEIIARGFTPKILQPITYQNLSQYEDILGPGTVLEDFPRCDQPENVEALKEMLYPGLSGT